MHEERYLEHYAKGKESSNHKYISRFFKNGKWYYRYAKDALKSAKIDADYYGMKAGEAVEKGTKKVGDWAYDKQLDVEIAAEKAGKKVYNAVGGKERDAWKKAEKDYQEENEDNRFFKKSDKEMLNKTQLSQQKELKEKMQNWENYDDATLRDKKSTARGKKQVYENTALGKAESRVNKFKKKLKHDDFSSIAITGQQLIDNMLGR